MAAEFKVFTKKQGDTSILVVRPPFAFTKSGGDVRVKNRTEDTIRVTLPAALGGTEFDVPSKKQETEKVSDKVAEGAYEFQIKSLTTLCFAVGNSDPEIIIES